MHLTYGKEDADGQIGHKHVICLSGQPLITRKPLITPPPPFPSSPLTRTALPSTCEQSLGFCTAPFCFIPPPLSYGKEDADGQIGLTTTISHLPL